jgi:CDP-glycerol glycerophosphotransferase
MDNAKYLFEYIHHRTDIEAVWITKKKEIVQQLRSQGYKAYLEQSSEAKKYATKAKIAIITHRGNRNEGDIPMHYFTKQTKIIQLWHGIPLKKIAYDDKIFSFNHNEQSLKYKLKGFVKQFIPFLNYVNKPTLIPALSHETQQIFSQAFRVPKENVVITGYPRNDIMLRNAQQEDTVKTKKKIIYMPTFRGAVNSDFDLFLQYGFDLKKMDTFLEMHHMQLDIKLHPFNRPSQDLLSALKASRNISFLDYDAIYEIIHTYDILITDYSSIYFDYLLLDRPIVFAPFDQETYMQNDREFYFDYETVTPGPKAMDWNEVIEALQQFDHNPDLYSQERQSIKNRFHTYQDDNSTERVYQAILQITNREQPAI